MLKNKSLQKNAVTFINYLIIMFNSLTFNLITCIPVKYTRVAADFFLHA